MSNYAFAMYDIVVELPVRCEFSSVLQERYHFLTKVQRSFNF